MNVSHMGGNGYKVASETSAGKHYIVRISEEGVGKHICNCTAWAIKRNKNGGTGAPSHCKHITAVLNDAEYKKHDAAEALLATMRDLERG